MIESIVYVVGGVVLVYIAICGFYFFFQERFIFVPWFIKGAKGPLILGSRFTEYFIDGDYGGRIHAIHIHAKNPRGCILYFHGNTGSIPRWGLIAEELTSFGFDIFLPDYRGFGKSTGKRSEEILYNDALSCYKKVAEMYPENQICIYGRSLGTTMAAWLSARTNAGGVVLEAPFNNLIEVAIHSAKIIPAKLFLRYTFRSDLFLEQTKMPVLIAHGTKDKIVPYKSGLRLYKLIEDKPNTEMLTIPGGNHSNLNRFPVFRITLNRFFDRYFQSPPNS